MIVKAILIKEGEPEVFDINVTSEKYIIVKKKLIEVYEEIMQILREDMKKGKINNLSLPRDIHNMRSKGGGVKLSRSTKSEYQMYLDRLVMAKRTIKDSLNKINAIYG